MSTKKVDRRNNSIVIGMQWGDEGKGRITDLLAKDADIISRFSGGNNAGHTVIVGTERFELHLIPCGILYPEKKNLLGNGMVIHPEAMVKEMEKLEKRDVSIEKLFISDRANVIMPYHLLLDKLEEARKGKAKIGTTQKGIGPAYTDKAARRGIQMNDLLDLETLREKLEVNLSYTNLLLTKIYNAEAMTADEIIEAYKPWIEKLQDKIVNTSAIINQGLKENKDILFEGAQGTMLDIDHGTYPFVTSSNASAGGVCAGCGVGPTYIDEVLGVAKAYTTRVGAGPFPTEDHGPEGKRLQDVGHEVGVTTGRPRRCGWFDLPLMKHAIEANGTTQLAITKLDVLGSFETIKICTGYRYQDQVLESFPTSVKLLEQVEPIYKSYPGWNSSISDVRDYDALPKEAKAYIEALEELCGIPVVLIGTGPEREQIVRKL